MAEKLKVTSETLDRWAQELRKSENGLSDALSILSGFYLPPDVSKEIKVSLNAHFSNGANLSGNNVAALLISFKDVLKKFIEDFADAAKTVEEAARLFEKVEEIIQSILNGLPGFPQTGKGGGGGTGGETIEQFKERMANADRETWMKEYYDILRSLPPGSNPLDDPRIVALITNELTHSGYTEAQARLIIDKLNSCSADYRDIYVYSFFDYEKFNGDGPTGGGVYVPSENKLYANASDCTTDEEFLELFFHESGHAIDQNANAMTNANMKELYGNLRKDVTSHVANKINQYGDGLTIIQKVRVLAALTSSTRVTYDKNGQFVPTPPSYLSKEEQAVYIKVSNVYNRELKGVPHKNDCMVSDVYGGITNNKLYGGYGHFKEYYWFDSNGQPTNLQSKEAWAEYYSCKVNGDTKSDSVNQAYFPDSTKTLDRLASETADYYRNKVRNGK